MLSWGNVDNFIGRQMEYKAESVGDADRLTDRTKGRIINGPNKIPYIPCIMCTHVFGSNF